MSNTRTKRITIPALMSSRGFTLGFEDARSGVPFRKDAELIALPKAAGAGGQWSYERGRQFACIYRGALREGRKIGMDAMRAFDAAYRARVIL